MKRNLMIAAAAVMLLGALVAYGTWAVPGMAQDKAAVSATAVDTAGYPDKLAKAINETPAGTGTGEINPDAEKGYLGIPGINVLRRSDNRPVHLSFPK